MAGLVVVCAEVLFAPTKIAARDAISHGAQLNMLRRLEANMVTSLRVRVKTAEGSANRSRRLHVRVSHTVLQSKYTGRKPHRVSEILHTLNDKVACDDLPTPPLRTQGEPTVHLARNIVSDTSSEGKNAGSWPWGRIDACKARRQDLLL
jgi:hypothetical protein